MRVVFWPDFTDAVLEASVSGDVLTINGEAFDLSPIKEGFQLPGTAIGSYWFHHTPITRIDGQLSVTIKLPVTPLTPEAVRNPCVFDEVTVTEGRVPLPDTSAPVVEPENAQLEEELQDGPESAETDPDA